MEQLAVSWFAACGERGNISIRAAEREKTTEPNFNSNSYNHSLVFASSLPSTFFAFPLQSVLVDHDFDYVPRTPPHPYPYQDDFG